MRITLQVCAMQSLDNYSINMSAARERVTGLTRIVSPIPRCFRGESILRGLASHVAGNMPRLNP